MSPTYAGEIRTPEAGMGLDGLLRARAPVLSGILNGIDDAVWNPATDPHLPAAFDARHADARGANKARAAGPLRPRGRIPARCCSASSAGSPGRRAWTCCSTRCPRSIGRGAQLVVLGTGDARAGARASPPPRRVARGRVGAVIGYDEALAHLIQAGGDALLVPSRFEPCGLTQLCALRYGAVPVVARVGGLADTVIDANEMALAAGVGTGVSSRR